MEISKEPSLKVIHVPGLVPHRWSVDVAKKENESKKKILIGIWKWESIGAVSSSLSTSTLHFFLKVKEVTCQLGKASVSGSSIWLPAALPSTYVGSCFKACWEV